MTNEESSNGMFTNKISLRVGEKELENNLRHSSDIERTESSSVATIEKMADVANNNDHVVHIDKWADSIERILEGIPQYMCNPGHPGRISRIPDNLREVDRNAYEPIFLSIGPYHHGRTRLQSMERRKRLFLKLALEKRPELALKDYLEVIKSLEPVARSFYSDIEMNSEEFVRMLLLDGIFVIAVFCNLPESQESSNQSDKTGEMGTGENNENMHEMARTDESDDDTSEESEMPRWFWILFMHDIFLLENQIPFFVLKQIYALAYGGPGAQLKNILKHKVGTMLLSYTRLDSEMMISPAEDVYHILHLCHMFFRPTLPQESSGQLPESSQMFRLGSASQLYESGVNFEARPHSSQHCLLDITVGSSGRMTMSSLQVDDNTISLLRNLIALEQMKYPSLGLNVSAYAVLLLYLITVPEDVKLLRRKGIIRHHLASDKEMVYLVNRLSMGLAFDYVEDNYSLKRVFQELKSYSERRAPRWRAWLEHRYFNNPWTMISLTAATLLLLMSAIQTYYAVYSYYFPYLDGHS